MTTTIIDKKTEELKRDLKDKGLSNLVIPRKDIVIKKPEVKK